MVKQRRWILRRFATNDFNEQKRRRGFRRRFLFQKKVVNQACCAKADGSGQEDAVLNLVQLLKGKRVCGADVFDLCGGFGGEDLAHGSAQCLGLALAMPVSVPGGAKGAMDDGSGLAVL